MQKKTHSTSIRLTEQGHELLVQIANYYGISQGAIIETYVREKARELNLLDQNHTSQ